MSAFKTYKGGRLDLEHYRGVNIIAYEFDITNDDDTAFDLSIYDDIIIKVYEKIHGTLKLSFDFQGGISTDSPSSSGKIYWNATRTQTGLRPKTYYHECYGTKQSGVIHELLFHGVSEQL